MLGKVKKTSSGPDVGLMPNEKTAGNMAMPDRMATVTSDMATKPPTVGEHTPQSETHREEGLSHCLKQRPGCDFAEIGT